MTTLIKICGVTDPEDADRAVELGADMLGFNFYDRSPRYISPSRAKKIVDQLGTNVEKIGVFVNAPISELKEIVELCGLDAVQLHGDEPAEYVESLAGLKAIKAFRLRNETDSAQIERFNVDRLLIDAFAGGEYGGTGRTCDWTLAAKITAAHQNVILSGGLGADNVGEAIRTVRPYAVDVCSRIESRKGRKDHDKMRDFISAVRNV